MLHAVCPPTDTESFLPLCAPPITTNLPQALSNSLLRAKEDVPSSSKPVVEAVAKLGVDLGALGACADFFSLALEKSILELALAPSPSAAAEGEQGGHASLGASSLAAAAASAAAVAAAAAVAPFGAVVGSSRSHEQAIADEAAEFSRAVLEEYREAEGAHLLRESLEARAQGKIACPARDPLHR